MKVTRLRLVIFPPEIVKTSMSLPGVPTSSSQPFLNAESCSPMGAPPTAQTQVNPTTLHREFASRWI
eukprot:CAMPEP_0206621582 /NCGR_PEP_ID=MMETSP0325_2-20121206/62292_1 /ASSEMBLY_ACC=CAM_ASM_000347 /TAXON_ID=2866 /ORGANISM="Crypthecodinium cohnii, Strain Seligo" /LENGTH=66 /DNA_ID=CAMNT_0054144735 /DNA_START=272 /DNA_END=472 /DNA_ORIENTATION=+